MLRASNQTLSVTSEEAIARHKHRFPLPRVLRIAAAALIAVAILCAAAPFVSASHFAGAIQRNLEAFLGRQVDFSAARFTLLTGPGFALEDVTIHEDPRYGLEPFAHATELVAHLRIDKLLGGEIRFSSLRLVEPSLNLVKRADGTWNVVELVQRLAAPRRMPLNLFPAFEIADGRINFKFGARKTTLYITDSDFTIYPARSGKLFMTFSGSPARTDRAGNGFGHLRGGATWYFAPRYNTNQLEADVTIDPSNLGEMTTLVQGYDIGVHGTVSSHFRVSGPATALRIQGELHFTDIHRWDLLPSSGEDWRVRYRGNVDLLAHNFELETVPGRTGEVAPVTLQLRANDFLTHPEWSLVTALNNVSARELLPLAKRMGLPFPQQLSLDGAMNGAISYSSRSGLSGGVSMKDVVLTLPGAPPLRTAVAIATLAPDRIRLDPAIIQTASGGTLEAAGDYSLSTQRLVSSLSTDNFSLDDLKSTANAWFGEPPGLALLEKGTLSGRLTYAYDPKLAGSWSGQFQFADVSLKLPALAVPLTHSRGRITFSDTTLDLDRFSASVGDQQIFAVYHYNAAARRSEHLRVELPSADFKQVEAALDPTLRSESFFARLRLTRRSIPQWLAERNLDGDLTVGQFSLAGNVLGPLAARFTWQGPQIQFASVQLHLPEGLIRANGSVYLGSYTPQYRFEASANGFPWRSGLLGAEGELATSGIGLEILQNLRATGDFSARNVQLSADDLFERVRGNFAFSFADGWPDLRLSNIDASDGEDAWEGQGQTQSEGKLIVNLEHDGQQKQVISTLAAQNASPAAFVDTAPPQ